LSKEFLVDKIPLLS